MGHLRRALATLGVGLVVGVSAFAAAPTGLTTECRENPVGLDAPAPRLSWRLPDGPARQAA
jgi:hypothetical protein